MHVMRPTITIESTNASEYCLRTSVLWTEAGFQITADNGVAHGGTGAGPDGFELLGAALGHCMLITLIAAAKRDGVALTRAEAQVATKSKLQGAESAPYISDFEVDIFLEGDLTEGQRRKLEQATIARCGVRETLMRIPRIAERVHVGRPSDGCGHDQLTSHSL